MKQNEINKTWLKDVRKTITEGKKQLPADGWDKISMALSYTKESATNNQKSFRWFYSAVAAVLALIVAVVIWMKTPTPLEKTITKIESIESSNDKTQYSSIVEKIEEENIITSKNDITQYSANKFSRIMTTELIVKDTELIEEVVPPISENDSVTNCFNNNNKETKEKTVPKLESKYDQNILFAKNGTNCISQKTTYSLSFYSGLNSTNYDASHNVSKDAGEREPPMVGNETTNPENNEPLQNVIRVKNNKAWSFGLSFRLMQNSRISYESGLTFTQLTSDAEIKNSALTTTTEKQTLYYLGVPLRFSYSFYNNPRWQFYASTGIMLEYCLKGKIGNYTFYNNNWQWSVNGALGGQFNLSKNIGIYIEPGINYYLNNQSGIKSIRTESPVIMNVNIGIRFTR